MGLFDFLFGKPSTNVEVLGDRVWVSQKAKLRGLRSDLEARSAAGSGAILLVAHFPDTLKQLETLAAEYQGRTPVAATLAERRSSDLIRLLHLTQSTAIDVIVGERHPLPDMDDALLQLLEELPCRCRVVHHLSLEDPLLKQFVGEWVGDILVKLGLKENEAIQSNLVTRRIKAAQQKIQAEIFGSARAADSAAEWMEKNLRT